MAQVCLTYGDRVSKPGEFPQGENVRGDRSARSSSYLYTVRTFIYILHSLPALGWRRH